MTSFHLNLFLLLSSGGHYIYIGVLIGIVYITFSFPLLIFFLFILARIGTAFGGRGKGKKKNYIEVNGNGSIPREPKWAELSFILLNVPELFSSGEDPDFLFSGKVVVVI